MVCPSLSVRGGVEGPGEDPGEAPPRAGVSDGRHANRDNHLQHIPHRCLCPSDTPEILLHKVGLPTRSNWHNYDSTSNYSQAWFHLLQTDSKLIFRRIAPASTVCLVIGERNAMILK